MAEYEWNMTFIDGEGHTASTGGNLNVADEAAAVARMTALSQLVVAGINGRMTKIGLTRTVALPAANPANPDPRSEVERKAAFTFLTAADKRCRISFPTWNPLYIQANSDVVFPAIGDPIVAELVGGSYRDTNDQLLVSLISYLEAYGRKR